MRFKDKVVLVTGASRGIGRAIAIGFGKEGASVVVNYANSKFKADEVVKLIEKQGTRAIAIKCDISSEKQVQDMIKKTVQLFGKLDILVNNAGIGFSSQFTEIKLEQWKRTFDVNLIGAFLCSKHAAIQMRKQNYGRIVNIGSTDGINTYDPGSVDYAATKAALINFSKNLAVALGPEILVNCVAPGWVETDMTKGLSREQVERELSRQVIKRFSKPEEQANAVLFLASDEASYITGSVLVVDGGFR
ncbi:MAG: 3-oxoacyl-ACP reductase FabG [Thermoplasmatales archaeon]|nr:3-oxoacyl-ACP reductase FabG [Candidatus Thermoplasmatota archaeon]MCL6002793.1 3-oxoacyl-ACP reductase FabG [Candidatus Thermoplasmatota archaeon]MDA8056132.1 3-oxoacyl-ACP reductase FabG [Thermoplasmatales archaeon]